MAVGTVRSIRDKNQITLPDALLVGAGLRRGDLIEFEPLTGGIAIYPYGKSRKKTTLAERVANWAAQVPGVSDVDDLELPSRPITKMREVTW